MSNSSCELKPSPLTSGFITETSVYNGAISSPIPIACNEVVGSVNLYTGQVQFVQFGYNQLEWAVYL